MYMLIGAAAFTGLSAAFLSYQQYFRDLNERELTRLDEAWSGPRLELPLLAVEQGPALTEALATRMEGA